MPALLALGFALAVYALRVGPHPWNVAPVAAAMLCAGALLPRRWAIVAPLAGSLAADAVIGFDQWPITLTIYGTYLLTWGIGRMARGKSGAALRERAAILGLGSLAGSVLFFLSTNWAVWMWSGLYPASWTGLLHSYVMAVPFFKATLVGDLLFVGFFAVLAICAQYAGRRVGKHLPFSQPSVL